MFPTIQITLYSYKSKILPFIFLEMFQFQINIRKGVLVCGWAVIVGKRLTLIVFKRSTWSREERPQESRFLKILFLIRIVHKK